MSGGWFFWVYDEGGNSPEQTHIAPIQGFVAENEYEIGSGKVWGSLGGGDMIYIEKRNAQGRTCQPERMSKDVVCHSRAQSPQFKTNA